MFTVNKINMKLIEATLPTMIDLIIKTVIHDIGRDQVSITTIQSMIGTMMAGLRMTEEYALKFPIIIMNHGDLMIMVGETKRNRLVMLPEAKKTITVEGQEE